MVPHASARYNPKECLLSSERGAVGSFVMQRLRGGIICTDAEELRTRALCPYQALVFCNIMLTGCF